MPHDLSALLGAILAGGQALTGATYITGEQIERVNATPGIDRTLTVVDLGYEHFAVGVIHRGPLKRPVAAIPPTSRGAPCGTKVLGSTVPLTPGLTHAKQTEGYYITSGSGLLVTGGQILNGRAETADSDVVARLNGPSCRGGIGGKGVVERHVKAGDVIIIPQGVPHGWAEIDDHVDYVSFRPSRDALKAGYKHPAIANDVDPMPGGNKTSSNNTDPNRQDSEAIDRSGDN